MLLAWELEGEVDGRALLVVGEGVVVVEDGQGAGVWRMVLKQRGDLLVLLLAIVDDEEAAEEVVVE